MTATSRHRAASSGIALACCAVLPGLLHAQDRLLGFRTSRVGVVYESWGFGAGIPQRTEADSVLVRRVSQWSVPVSVEVPLGRQWTMDVSGAYSAGEVRLAGRDAGGASRYRLAGPTDLKVRAVGHLVGDRLLLTLGVNAPTGKVSLDREGFAALRVLASPALRLQSPAFGRGAGGTVGLVLARQVASWGLALAGSYEKTTSYTPTSAFIAGAASPTLFPGDAVHLSLGADGLVGQSGMTLAVTADAYSAGYLSASSGAGAGRTAIRLGPTLTGEWQLRFAAPRFRELSFYAVDRYRTRYRQDGATVAGSSGNQADATLRAVVPLARPVGLLLALDGRHQTGLSVDRSLATAAMVGGGATVGLEIGSGRASLQPFVRGQLGRIDAGGTTRDGRALSAGITLGTRF